MTNDDIETSTTRRLWLSNRANREQLHCPDCGDKQLQLINYIGIVPATWKCRNCGKVFDWEPKLPPITEDFVDCLMNLAGIGRMLLKPDSKKIEVNDESKLVPWTREDVPPVCWLRRNSETATTRDMLVTSIFDTGIQCEGGMFTSHFINLLHWYEWSSDLKNWSPCVKKVKE